MNLKKLITDNLSVWNIFKIIVYLLILAFIILYFTGLGLLTKAMFTVENCGCTQTNASGELPVVVCSGTTCVTVNPGIPFSTSIIPIGDKKKLNLSSTEVNLSKMSIIVTLIVMIPLIISVISGQIIILNNIWFGMFIIILILLAIAYLTSLGIIIAQVFTLGNCGCDITVSAQSGTSSYFKNIKNNSVEGFDPTTTQTPTHTIIPGSPATVITIPAGSTPSLEKYNSDVAIGYSKFGLLLTWIIYIVFTSIVIYKNT